jgi:rhomboid protease GluP
MSRSPLTPMQEILRAVERAAPRPWHYREEARREGFNLAGVEQVLELLHLEGLVARGPSDPATGPGVVLTPRGESVAADPDLFARLGTGEPLDSADAGAIVRHSIRREVTPTLTRVIIAANVAVFAWSMYLANNAGGNGAFLRGPLMGGGGGNVLQRAGGLSAGDLVRGEWWRLLTCCFVHAGLIHIGMNMYALYSAGRFVEQVWGRWRYAVIYAVSGWGGSCMAMAMQPRVGLVGASGAICGVFAAVGVWFFLNGKYLPRGMARRGRSQIVTTVILMVFISLIPGVSGYGHLGGAVAGGLAAAALNVARFGPLPLRLLAWPVVIAIPFASYYHLDHARKTNPVWRQIEGRAAEPDATRPDRDADAEFRDFEENYLGPVQKVTKSALRAYDEKVKEVRDAHPARRDEAEVQAAVATLDRQIASLDGLVEKLEQSGPYRDEEVAEIRQTALAYARQLAEVFREAKRCLEEGKAWKGGDERKFDERWQKMRRLREEWEEWLKR